MQRVHGSLRPFYNWLKVLTTQSTRFAGLGFLLIVTDSAFGQETSLAAPYQIDGILQEPLDYGERALGPAQLMVDRGYSQSWSDEREAAGPVTVIGTEGYLKLAAGELRQHCTYLCELEAGPTCHFVSLHSLPPEHGLGLPLAVLAGAWDLEAFQPLLPLQPADSPRMTAAADDFSVALWDFSGTAMAYRVSAWEAETRGMTLYHQRAGGEVFSEPLADCQVWAFDTLDFLTCGARSLVLHDGRPLLVDHPDYNLPSARPMASFTLAGRLHVLFELGLKAQTVYGLLIKSDAGWQAQVGRRDYPSLC